MYEQHLTNLSNEFSTLSNIRNGGWGIPGWSPRSAITKASFRTSCLACSISPFDESLTLISLTTTWYLFRYMVEKHLPNVPVPISSVQSIANSSRSNSLKLCVLFVGWSTVRGTVNLVRSSPVVVLGTFPGVLPHLLLASWFFTSWSVRSVLHLHVYFRAAMTNNY